MKSQQASREGKGEGLGGSEAASGGETLLPHRSALTPPGRECQSQAGHCRSILAPASLPGDREQLSSSQVCAPLFCMVLHGAQGGQLGGEGRRGAKGPLHPLQLAFPSHEEAALLGCGGSRSPRDRSR